MVHGRAVIFLLRQNIAVQPPGLSDAVIALTGHRGRAVKISQKPDIGSAFQFCPFFAGSGLTVPLPCKWIFRIVPPSHVDGVNQLIRGRLRADAKHPPGLPVMAI